MKKRTIINAPIMLLHGFMSNPQQVIFSIVSYGFYRCAVEVDEKAKYAKSVDEKVSAIAKAYKVYQKNLTKNDVLQKQFDEGQELHHSLSFNDVMGKKPATFGVSVDVLFAYYREEKTSRELAIFLMFCAIKSILGNKAHCLTNYGLIVSRMAGLEKSSFSMGTPSDGNRDLLIPKEGVNISKLLFEQVANRYRLNKLRDELEMSWGVIYYGAGRRGFYVGIDKGKGELKRMIKYAISQKKKTKEAAIAGKKMLAKMEAIAELNGNNQ